MPTKKDVFLAVKELLETNISDVSGRVYSAFPKKKYILPLIVISNISLFADERVISGSFIKDRFSVEVILFTKTSQELDEISQQIQDVLRGNVVIGRFPDSIADIDSLEYLDENGKVIHRRTISVVYSY